MRRKVIRLVLVVPLLLSLSGQGPRPCETCGWSDRGDRFEGVKGRQVSGGCCEVLGAHYQGAAPLADAAPLLYLHFRMPAAAKPEIVVWQPSSNYLMIPKEKPYPAGAQSFSWPRQAVVAPLQLRLDGLYARVSTTAKVYLPVQLSTDSSLEPARSYRFFIESGGGLVGKTTIEREEAGLLTTVREYPLDEEFGGVFPVDWDGRDAAGRASPPGVYALRLKGRIEADTIIPFNFVAHFQHYGPLS